jgi:protein-L-isoaspartate(D-aspartate) O-methyltransferase
MKSSVSAPAGCARMILACRVAVLMALVATLGVPSCSPGANEAIRAAEASVTQTPTSAVEWERPRFSEREDERQQMVLEQISGRGVDDPAVLAAMGYVPRHRFVPEHYLTDAYRDTPLPIGYGQTISQPYIVAYMTAALAVEQGDRVLEIGTGSGYQAAVLSELTPSVFTIEILDVLGAEAADRLASLGYGTIETKIGDGYYGWEENGPFDAIIVTCAAGHIPPPLIEQLRSGGRMVIPVGPVYDVQYLIRATKDDEGAIRSERLLPVRFVPMTGRVQEGR